MAPSHRSSSASGPEPTLDGLLAELVELPRERRPAALQAMCSSRPDLAEALQRRLALLDDLELLGGDDVVSEFGRFHLLHQLGAGMTDVHLARDPERADPVVVKILRHAGLREQAVRESLLREATIAARLRHPCIVGVLETGEVDGMPYLVEPYVDGITLAAWIQGQAARGRRCGPEDLDLVCSWLEDVARALHAAHEAGLVHRDVKPDNILIPWRGPPQLLDFGLAQEITATPQEATGTPVCGTLAYMAPELLVPRERSVGPAADVFALGVTLYEAVTGRLPFQGDTAAALCRSILVAAAPSPRRFGRGLPPELDRVVAAALAKEAWRRYATAADFADDLGRLRRGEAVLAPHYGLLQHAARWIRHHRPTAVLALLTLLLSAVLVATNLIEASARAGRDALAAEADLLDVPERLRAAAQQARELVPGWPHQIEALAAWLDRDGEPLAAGLPALRARAAALDATKGATLELVGTVQAALRDLESFTAPHGLLERMRERLRWARAVQAATVDAHAASWRDVQAAIAADPRYGGLVLRPQLDLVPLGPDPGSHLFEFYHPRSGWPGAPAPHREASTKRLVLHDGAGLVFVLLPKARCTVGWQATDPAGTRYHPQADRHARVQTAELDAFFVSKFELTQAQWWRLTGQLPSYFRLGHSYGGDPAVGYRHPVESVSAEQCDEVLRECGLLLPTEAQWEYACSCGAPTRFWFGDDESLLPRFANLLDRRQLAVQPGVLPAVDADDGHAFPAAVGSYEPNAFGLHDMLGNVAEWCRDHFTDYALVPVRPGDGLREVVPRPGRTRILRGSSYTCDPPVATARRNDYRPDHRHARFGLRPVRAVLEDR